MEVDRQTRRRRLQQRLWLLALVAAIACALAYVFAPEPAFFYLISAGAVLVCGFVAKVVYDYAQASWQDTLRTALLPAICDPLGLRSNSTDPGNLRNSPFEDLGLLPNYTRSRRPIELSGNRNGIPFNAVHVRLTRKNHSNVDGTGAVKTLFEGHLITITLPRGLPTPSRMSMFRNQGRVSSRLSKAFSAGDARSMAPVPFPKDSDFAKRFAVHCDTPEAALAFLSSDMRQALCDVEDRGVSLSGGVAGGHLFLALELQQTVLTFGNLSSPMADIETHLAGAMADMTELHDIVDTIIAALPGAFGAQG